ncbi:transposase [Geodermatophilus sp. URMC 62]|uniref:transposase n=1 Tax=Geodermatophilus sp. URMC 62 TaxID=3423414 RepID=UPI00406D48E7
MRGFEATAVAVMNGLTPADGIDRSLISAGLQQLQRFRGELHRYLGRRRDALFGLVDALLAAESMPSLPHLSLVPAHRRGWGSVSVALAAGEVDAERLAELLVAHRGAGAPVFAVDASTWARCDAECSPKRGFYYSPTRHSAGQPIVAGWCYSWIAQLSWARDSWTAPLDVRRLVPGEELGQATAAQIRALTARLGATGAVPLFVFDAGYDPIALTVDLAALAVAVLVRIRGDRVFYTDPAARAAGQMGRPRRHGARFCCIDPASRPAPQQSLEVDDEQYGRVQVTAWAGLHPKLAGRGRWVGCPTPPIVAGTVIRVQVEHLPGPRGRAVKTLWLWWAGPGTPDLDLCWRAYIRRFDLEHTFRFCKQSLGWTTPRVRTPGRLSAGPGWCSPPTPSCGWPARSPPTRGCPGNAGYRPPD